MYMFNRITVNPQLPSRISKLTEISNNLWWSWNTEFLKIFKEIDIAPYIRDVSVKFEDGIVKINAKLSASINQTHPHINPENIVTMLKDKLGILSGDVAKEQYDIIRTRIYFEDGKTDFR